ncbi:MSMEG_0570 family nitrogen starvation response protein [Actinospica sp. MGRD01-02]|uniref:MSMEG_0570 family nitrogen starvation response protein n=1 Tax=Actinospica acidithermotolerans TaxID=2828514 RepID=A0A941EAV2_9ACTN|nr:MSMEG_0570 family nitrogen starvation response protein [Actinospica acidithermotolerans]
MPEMYVVVRWPDGVTQRCYSPSTVVADYFAAGAEYAVAEFVERSRTALGIAGERVRDKYGFLCTGASAELARIEQAAAAYARVDGATVTVEALVDADGRVR